MSTISVTRTSRFWLILPVLVAAAVAAYFGGTHLVYSARLRAATAAEQTQDFAAAAELLTRYQRFDADAPAARLLAARLSWRPQIADPDAPGGWDAAARRHLAGITSDPAFVDPVAREELILDALAGQLSRAEPLLWKRVAANDPDTIPILEALTYANIVAHRFPAAAAASARLLDIAPEHAAAYYWRGLMRELTNGALGSAVPDYQRAVELAPQMSGYRVRLAHVYLSEATNFSQAEQIYEQLVAERPDDSTVVFGLGRCRLRRGEAEAAIPLLRQAVAVRPDDGDTLANLGQALSETGDSETAEPLLRRAVEIAPNSRTPNYQLGLCLSRLGQAAEAQPYLDRAEQIAADSQRVHELSRELFKDPTAGAERRVELAELLLRTGQTRLAQYWLESAVATDPGYEPARKALATLAASSGRRPAP